GYGGNLVIVEWQITLDVGDITAPTGSISINNGAEFANNTNVTVSLNVTDALSGLYQMRFSTDNSQTWTTWETYASTKTLTLSSGDGTKELRAQIKDKAGNAAVFTDSIMLDTIAPQIQLVSEAYVYHRHYELRYKLDGVEKTEIIQLAAGKNKITRDLADEAGNASFAVWNIYLDESAERGTFFDYDPNGNITSRRDANGRETKYEYDANNQLTKVTYADGAVVRYTYNERGDRTSMEDSVSYTYYSYDAANRLQFFQQNGESIDYDYDLAGNLIYMNYQDVTVLYSYDEANRLKEVTEQKTGEDGKITSYTYNDADDLTSEILPNGVKTRYLYDDTGRLTEMIHEKMETGGTVTFLDSYQYTLDAAGNRTRMVETRGTGASQTVRTLDYTYDLFGRLVREISATNLGGSAAQSGGDSNGTTEYAYDAAGNRLSKNFIPSVITADNPRILTAYTYGIDNRLLGLVEGKFDVAGNLLDSKTEYSIYDAAGNRIQKITPDKTYHYGYDSMNRLVAWTDEKDFLEFAYDADGNRTGKRVNGEWTYYMIDPNRGVTQVLAELDAAGAVKQTYTYGLDRVSVTSHQTTATSYFLQDGLGSSVGLTDSTGSVTESYSYDAFGNSLTAYSLPPTASFLYTGEQLDPETGLIYLRARYYDPTLGRFISRDPVLGNKSQTQSFNPYPYVQNDPINFIDPLGLEYERRRRPFEDERVSWLWYVSRDASHQQIFNTANPEGDNFGLFASDKIEAEKIATYNRFKDVYETIETFPNDDIVNQAKNNLKESYDQDWCLLGNNCQDFGAAFSREYHRLEELNLDDNTQKIGWDGPGGGSGGGFWDNLGDTLSSWGNSLLGAFRPESVGGVLLDKALDITGLSIKDITGVTYDPVTGQVVLLGEAGGTVPEIPMDYLITALKAVFGSEEDPGVTIEAKKNPDGTPDWSQPLDVTHFANIEDTELGWVVYEADRLMKSITQGKDNITQSTVTEDGYDISESNIQSRILGFKTLLTRWTESGETGQDRYSRLWFLPKEMKLVRSDSRDAFVFDNNSVELRTELINSGNGNVDPDAQAFADFFTEHYDQFAELYPIYEELKKAARAVALAKFILDHNIPVDLNWLATASLVAHPTPRITPVGQNSNDTTGIIGGVTMDFINSENFTYLPDTLENAAGLRTNSLGERLSDLETQWNFSSGSALYDASAFSFAPTRKDGNFSWRERDLGFSTAGDFDLSWLRFYDSFNTSQTQLGFGWRFAPYTIETTEKSQSYVFSGSTRDLFPRLRFIDRIHQMTETMFLTGFFSDGTPVYRPEGKDTSTYLTMNAEGSFTVRYQDRKKVQFLSDGRLDNLEDQNGNQIQYSYDAAGKLISISDVASQRALNLVYDAAGRVSAVNGPENKNISYAYDVNTGDLETSTESWTNRTTTYVYDNEHRLLSAMDHTGKVLFVNAYDLMGRLTSQIDAAGNYREMNPDLLAQETVVTDPVSGAQSRLTYDSLLRLTESQDALGNLTNFVYGGDYGPTQILDSRGNALSMTYDTLGLQTSRTNALNHTTYFDYSAGFGDARLILREDGTGYGPYMEYDVAGNLTDLWQAAYAERDADGNPTNYWVYPFRTQFGYDANGNLSSVTDANLHSTNFDYDSLGNLTRSTDALGKSTDRTYETQSDITEIDSGAMAHGQAQIDTTQFRFGGSSLYLDGDADYLALPDSEDFDFSGGQYTVDFWIKPEGGNSQSGTLYNQQTDTQNYSRMGISNGKIWFRVIEGGMSVVEITTPVVIQDQAWHHVALVENGDSWKIYLDGTEVGSQITSARTKNYAGIFEIGSFWEGLTQYYKGWMDDFRISNGVARWTSNFNPAPEEVFPDNNTTLLLRFNGADGSPQFYKTTGSQDTTNRLSSIKDPLNHFINFTYDPVNQRVKSIQNAAGQTQYDYDSRDRLSEITDAVNRKTQFQYNANDQLIETREIGNPSDALDDILAAFDYDRLGNLTSIAGPLGGATAFTYDLLNRLTRIMAPESTPLARVENIQVGNMSENSAQIHASVSETIARAELRIYETGRTAYKTVTLEGPLSGEIVFDVEGLLAGTEYEYEIEVMGAAAHHSISKKRALITTGESPGIPPLIESSEKFAGQVLDITSTTAVIGVYDPDVPFAAVKEYKITVTPKNGGNSITQTFSDIYQDENGIWWLRFSAEISGLTANTEYDFTIEVVGYSSVPFDEPAPLLGSFKTANPADQTKPVVQVDEVTADIDQAVLEFQTDEPLLWMDLAVIDYFTGEREDYFYYAPGASGRLLIPDLKPDSVYSYYLFPTDLSGNAVTSAYGKIFYSDSFDGDSTLILKNEVIERTPTSANIAIMTDEIPQEIVADYRELDSGALQFVSTVPSTRNTTLLVNDLASGKDYEYRIRAVDASENRILEDWQPLVLSNRPSVPAAEEANGIFQLNLDGAILSQAAQSGAVGIGLELSKKLLSSFQDQYDFLIFAPSLSAAKRLSLAAEDSTSDNYNGSFYLGAFNDVNGLGQELVDFRDEFGSGSAGELEGIVFLDAGLSSGDDFRFASSDFTQERNRLLWQNVLTQELSHRYGSFLTSEDGNPLGILGRGLAHWGVFFDADFSPMDGNDWIDNGDGSFTLAKSYIDEAAFERTENAMLYNDLDLYSMGLLDPTQVGASFVIENPRLQDGRSIRPYSEGPYVEIQNSDGSWEGLYHLGNGTKVLGTKRVITLDEIAALEGMRNPSSSQAPKDFKVAFVTVDNEEEAAIDSLEMNQKLERFRDEFMRFFEEMTRGLGSLVPLAGESVNSASSSGSNGSSGTIGVEFPEAHHSHSHFGPEPFKPIDRTSLKAVDFAERIEKWLPASAAFSVPALSASFLSGRNVLRAFEDQVSVNGSLHHTPSPSPVKVEALSQRENVSLEKPVLYSEWKEQNTPNLLQTFPDINEPLPAPLPWVRSTDAAILPNKIAVTKTEEESIVPLAANDSERIESENHLPQRLDDLIPDQKIAKESDRTPLIWDALARRYQTDNKETLVKKRRLKKMIKTNSTI
ncbi:MAG: hypothetical protein HYZ85_04755, partial [Candidatus Omnitrophica bacterium]|nr:hypothetical protein [Candidatus Omnitrophota bacterium]